MPAPYDALILVSFGGPDGPDDVIPFLENVLRGRNVPRQRMMEVAEHYFRFGGKSPINEQNRQLAAAIEQELAANGPPLSVYWGNRNWHPLLPDTLRQMAADGVRRALAFVTSAFSSYSGCRQYREDIARAQEEVGPAAPQVDKLRVFFNHPGFIDPMIERTGDALNQVPADRREDAALLFTAHSIPRSMAAGCRYEEQLQESSGLVAKGIGRGNSLSPGERESWRLVYQSRSGPPSQPWLEPDIGDFIESSHAASSLRDVIVVPIGFLSDHMEVVYDLDVEARKKCDALKINMVRAATVGTHARFVRMIRELIEERMDPSAERQSIGAMGSSHDICPEDCCLYGAQSPARSAPGKEAPHRSGD